MFTGIVEEVGVIDSLEDLGAQAHIRVRAGVVTQGTRPGDSVAVDGVCLTATNVEPGFLDADLMRVTLEVTAARSWSVGTQVNLERAVMATSRLGGHLVQGHVDGVARLVGRDSTPQWDDLTFELPGDLTRYVAPKGSITLSGISLTVTWAKENRFGVSLIPTTLAHTTAGTWQPGQEVNVEVDVIAKYVEKLLEGRDR